MKLFYFNPNNYGQEYFVMADDKKAAIIALNEYLKKEHIEQFNMYQRMQPTRKLKMTRIPRWTHKQFKDYTIDAYEKNRVIQSEIS